MKWVVPGKTFLVGEYAALAGLDAIILTTSPCYEMTLSENPGLNGIHPDAPAGRWWELYGDKNKGLSWYDPYHGQGGLGASSAQFIGAYRASAHSKDILSAYREVTEPQDGLRPSGYDVLAQSLAGCIYISHYKVFQVYKEWPFQDIDFILVHTGQKLSTHEHLKSVNLQDGVIELSSLVQTAKRAMDEKDSGLLIKVVNAYHQRLFEMGLVAKHSLKSLKMLSSMPEVRAAKGCGAMGSDVLLLLVPMAQSAFMKEKLRSLDWTVLASSTSLLKKT